jgi:tRNA nucleotidyltransferase (CCA-adding enzyme)
MKGDDQERRVATVCVDSDRALIARWMPNVMNSSSSPDRFLPAVNLRAAASSGRAFPRNGALLRLVDVVAGVGGRAVAVGGCVRDWLLGHDPKDIDVEVYGVPIAALEAAFAAAGFTVHAVGRSFGVLKVDVVDGGARTTFDVASPRSESKTGRGHRGFVVDSDPHMTFADAALRRDFTMNAMGVDLDSGALLDPWGGARDLETGVLRHVSDAFDEDPLRVLRGAQFAARFGLQMADDTIARCRRLQGELSTLPAERVGEELKKLLVKGAWPSVGLQVLRATGVVEQLFPELQALIGCPQEAEWHPEGDVWTHTLMVTDAAARLCRDDGLDDDERFVVVLSALCHDLGKPPTTEFVDGRIRSRDHERQGEAPTRAFCARLAVAHDVEDAVVACVREHLKPFQLWRERDAMTGGGDGAVRRLATRVPITRVVRVARADHLGRTTDDALAGDDVAGTWLLARAAALAVQDQAPKPLLLGRHLQARGLRPGKEFGVLLKQAFDAQLEGAFDDDEGALRWLDARLRGDT